MAGRVLFDTSFVSHHLQKTPAFARATTAFLKEFDETSGIACMSAVTLQELTVWALYNPSTREEPLRRYLAGVQVLPFTPLAAAYAALMQFGEQSFRMLKGRAREDAVDVWMRDAAIFATGLAHEVSLVVAADSRFARLGADFPGLVHVVKPLV